MMKFVDFSMSVLFLSAAFMCLASGSWLLNEVYLCYKPVVDINLQTAYDDGYQHALFSGHSIATDLSTDNPFE